MATTAGNIINRALRLVEALGDGETATAQESADCLEALNAMVDSWNAERLTLYQELQEQFTLTGVEAYTIGVGGVFNTTRPERLISGFFRPTGGTIDYPLSLKTKAEWDRIYLKTYSTYFPQILWYDEAYPLGVIHIWPQSSGLLFLTTAKQLTEFATTADVLSLPAGYRDALAYNLAARIAPEYGAPARQDVVDAARKALGAVRRRNAKTAESIIETAYLSSQGRGYDINRGY